MECNQPNCIASASILYTPAKYGKGGDDRGLCLSCFRPVFDTPSVGKCVDPEAKKVRVNLQLLYVVSLCRPG